ncbi:MAG TPA: ferric reductase-like transmembrane domain-containing protein [Rugosimonospora sp.]
MIALVAAVVVAIVGAGLTFTGGGKAVISSVYHFLEFYSGVFSLVSLSIAVMVGLAATDRIVLLVRHRVLLQAVHRATASTAMIFLCVHVFTKIVEGHASVVDVVVPFVASHKVVYIGLGTIASYLMFLVTWTGIIRGRFAGSAHPGLWRAVHASAYLSWIFALFHGLESGRQAKTWVTVSYVVCVILVSLALLVRLSVSWGRRMRSPKASTTGTIKAIGKPVPPRVETARSTIARTLDDNPFGARKTVDDDPFARRVLEEDDPFARRNVDDDPFARRILDGDAAPGRRDLDDDPFGRRDRDRDRDDDAVPGGRSGRGGHRSELDLPLALGEPGVEWYDEAGNHSFATGPVFSRGDSRGGAVRGGESRGSHAAREDAPVTGQPLAPLSYLDDARGHRLTPDVSYSSPEEEPAFPESAYQDSDLAPGRSGTGAYRQVRARDGWDRDSWGQTGPDRDDRDRDESDRAGDRGYPGSRDRTDGRSYAEAGNQRGYSDSRRAEPDYPTGDPLDARPYGEPERPMRRPRTPVDDLMTPDPAVTEPPKRRRRSLAELPAGPAEPAATQAPAAAGKPAEDISDEEFWAHMRGDVLR